MSAAVDRFIKATFKEGNYLPKETVLPTDGLRERVSKRALGVLKWVVDTVSIPVKLIGRTVYSTAKNVFNVISEPFEKGD